MGYICARYTSYTYISDAYIQPIALHIYTAYCTWSVISCILHIYIPHIRLYICARYMSYTYKSYINTAYCIWSVISSFSNFNRESSSLGLFCHVPLKRDQRDSEWRLRLNDTPRVIGCICAKYIQYICARYIQYICAKDIYVRLNDTPHVAGCICARESALRSGILFASPFLERLCTDFAF